MLVSTVFIYAQPKYQTFDDNSKKGLMEVATGKIILPAKYQDIDVNNFQEGLCAVKSNYHWGYVDLQGKEVVPCKYGEANTFQDGMALVAQCDVYYNAVSKCRYGYIDLEGKEVIPCRFVEAGSFGSGLAAVKQGGSQFFGYIDKTGAMILQPKYKVANQFKQSAAVVEDTDKFGLISKRGELILPYINTSIINIGYGVWEFAKDNLIGLINSAGKILASPGMYSKVLSNYNFGLAVVGREVGSGTVLPAVIDTLGKTIVPLDKYKSIDGYKDNGLAMVSYYSKTKNKMLYGYINNKGVEIVPCVYEYVDNFIKGRARVRRDGKSFIINEQGVCVMDCL
jgi:hypothetical protein